MYKNTGGQEKFTFFLQPKNHYMPERQATLLILSTFQYFYDV